MLNQTTMTRAHLKEYREKRNLSQKALAELLELPVSKVQEFEHGVRRGRPVTIPKWFGLALVGLKVTKGI